MKKTVESSMLYGRPFGGVITLVNNSLRKVTKTLHSEDRLVIVRVANYLLVNVHFPCVGTPDRVLICEDILATISSWCNSYSDCAILMAGDLNICLHSADEVAQRIHVFLKYCSLYRCDDIFPNQKLNNYINSALRQESCIDYCLTSRPNSVLNFAVLDHDINYSDHLPLSIYIDTDVRDQNVNVGRMNNINHTPVSKQLIWDNADLVSYYYHTGTLLLPILSRVDELLLQSSDNITDAHTLCTGIDSVYDEITQVLITAYRLYVPDRVKNFHKFWWNEELDILKEASISSNKLWKVAGRPRQSNIFDKAV